MESDLSNRLSALRETQLLDSPPEEAFDRLTSLTCTLLRTPVAIVSLVDSDRQFFKSAVGLAEPWASKRETPLSHSFCKHVVGDERPLVVPDARSHPVVCENPGIDELGVESYVGIPLFSPGGAAIGSLCAIDTKPREWTEHEVQTLSDLAELVMTEIASRVYLRERAEAEEALRNDVAKRQEIEAELRSLIRELELVNELSTNVTRARNPEEIYDRALRAVLESLKTDRASLLLFDDDDVMRFKAWRGLSDQYRSAVEGHTPWKRTDKEASPIVVEDVTKDASLQDYLDTFESEGIRSMIFVPLLFEDQVLGKFMAYFDKPNHLRDEEIQLAQTVANHVAFAIDRQVREDRLRQLNESLEERVRTRTAELTRANEELKRRNEDLQNFAHVASHDLQEPLRKISSFADLMIDDYVEHLDETARFYVERMQSSAVRMSHLLSDLLQYSRVATNKHRHEQVDLNEVVQHVLADLHVQIQESGASIEYGELPVVAADSTQMRQLVQNLISNAIKYRRRGVPPKVRIRADTSGARARIRVADNGMGFDEKYADRIFQPFERLYGAEFPGSGIGLAICRRIAELHGGSIEARSVPGDGSEFIVELPQYAAEASLLAEADADPNRVAQADAERASRSGRRTTAS